jgi:mttA/Hcf106 family
VEALRVGRSTAEADRPGRVALLQAQRFGHARRECIGPGFTPLAYDARVPDLLILLLIILAIVLYVRGPKVLPRWGAALGRGVRDVRRTVNGQLRDGDHEKDQAAGAAPDAEAPRR